jgi:MFS transporter, DHA1 family, multidrug resistance protein
MAELIRDTVFGHLLRWVSGGKILPHPEDKDPNWWKKYAHEEKTARLAQYGQLEEPERPGLTSSDSDDTRVGDATTNDLGMGVHPENGQDQTVIHFEENDPQDPMNWSLGKKCFVTFEICLLTTSVYIGSAIYSAGVQEVSKEFGVSQVAATLGLTLFVAGYGIGEHNKLLMKLG